MTYHEPWTQIGFELHQVESLHARIVVGWEYLHWMSTGCRPLAYRRVIREVPSTHPSCCLTYNGVPLIFDGTRQ